jgi:hypothetical protein
MRCHRCGSRGRYRANGPSATAHSMRVEGVTGHSMHHRLCQQDNIGASCAIGFGCWHCTIRNGLACPACLALCQLEGLRLYGNDMCSGCYVQCKWIALYAVSRRVDVFVRKLSTRMILGSQLLVMSSLCYIAQQSDGPTSKQVPTRSTSTVPKWSHNCPKGLQVQLFHQTQAAPN